MSSPLVSIITPSYNQGAFIEDTIQSVLAQSYPHFEYIVLDAGSTDNTPHILAAYQSHFAHLICEPDDGQANALNRGFQLAKGDIIAWLNADDLLLPDAVEHIVAHFNQNPASSFVYGDAIAMSRDGGVFGRRVNVAPCDYLSLVETGDFIVQPAAFWRRRVLETIGPLDETLSYTLDYEFWMRVARRYPLDYLPVPLAWERLYGGTKTSSGGIERIRELERIAVQHGGDDVPVMFRPEAAATYMRSALVNLLRRRWARAQSDYSRALSLNNHTLKFLLHLLVQLMWGGRGTMRLRLWSNLIRNYVSIPGMGQSHRVQPAPAEQTAH